MSYNQNEKSARKNYGMKKIDKSSLAERVADQLREYIDTEELEAGSKLPSEKILCEKYQVSRTTVRESLRLLQAFGYVQLVPNRGTFVAAKERRGISALNAWVMEHTDEVSNIYEVRIQLEPNVTALAVQRATPEEKYMIIGANTLFNEAAANHNINKMIEYDEQFHEYIMKASHNPFIVELNRLISDASREYRRYSFAADTDIQLAKDTHESIVNAIMAGNSEMAKDLMYDHLKTNMLLIERLKNAML